MIRLLLELAELLVEIVEPIGWRLGVVELDVERVGFELALVDPVAQRIARRGQVFELGPQKPVVPRVAVGRAVIGSELRDEVWAQRRELDGEHFTGPGA